MSKKIAIVTSLIGAYDASLLEFEYDRSKYDFICYTNMKRLKSDTWDIRYVEELQVPGDNAKSSYYYKWQPHKYLSDEYDEMVWVDSSFTQINMDEMDIMVQEFRDSEKALYIEKHPSSDTLMAELSLNVQLNKDDIDAMKNQVQRYFDNGYREDYSRMVETGISFRKINDKGLQSVSDTIWNEIVPEGNTKRDQLIYDYAVWTNDFQSYAFFTFQRKLRTIVFQDHPNRSSHKDKVLLVGPWFGEDEYEEEWVEAVYRYLSTHPVDDVIIGCRPGREHLYDVLDPDRVIATNPDGGRYRNLLDGRAPRFNITGGSTDKDIVTLTTDNPEVIDFNRNIHLLWATVRADEFDEYFSIWLDRCVHKQNIIPYIVVDSQEDKDKIKSVDESHIIVSTPPRKGVCYPSYIASSAVTSDNPRDIVVYGSDDFTPMPNWDVALYGEFTYYDGGLLVDDKVLPVDKDIMTIPIMNYATLERLNKVIYHPVYSHCYSDNELLLNLQDLGCIRDIRASNPNVYFEHDHYVNGGREYDEHDNANSVTNHTGVKIWTIRQKMSVEERLKINIDEPILSILVLTLEERKEYLDRLMSILEPQLTDNVEIIVESDNRENTIGKKRNNALAKATGRYIAFVDDDDRVSDDYVASILKAVSRTDVDCCSLVGEMTIDDGPTERFIHSLKYSSWENKELSDGNKEYYRPPNHLNVVRREIATYIGFDDTLSYGEDRDYSMRLRKHIGVESSINNVLYYYDCISDK